MKFASPMNLLNVRVNWDQNLRSWRANLTKMKEVCAHMFVTMLFDKFKRASGRKTNSKMLRQVKMH